MLLHSGLSRRFLFHGSGCIVCCIRRCFCVVGCFTVCCVIVYCFKVCHIIVCCFMVCCCCVVLYHGVLCMLCHGMFCNGLFYFGLVWYFKMCHDYVKVYCLVLCVLRFLILLCAILRCNFTVWCALPY